MLFVLGEGEEGFLDGGIAHYQKMPRFKFVLDSLAWAEEQCHRSTLRKRMRRICAPRDYEAERSSTLIALLLLVATLRVVNPPRRYRD